MKTVFIIAVIACLAMTVAAVDFTNPLVHDERLITYVNRFAKTWTAGKNAVFEGKTRADAKRMLGFKRPTPEMRATYPTKPLYAFEAMADLPTNYSSVTQKDFAACQQLHRIRNQAQCGACWAFSTTEMIADRFCIATKTKTNTVLSPQFLLSCDQSDSDCEGGDFGTALAFVQKEGVVTNNCVPFQAQNGSDLPCPTKCVDGSDFNLRYKVRKPRQFQQNDIKGMQQSILNQGPIVAGFDVYDDFFNYKGGVYVHTAGSYAGGHAVKVVGWGETAAGVPYWIVANSWTVNWGIEGYFWILRGENECNFETDVWEAAPAI